MISQTEGIRPMAPPRWRSLNGIMNVFWDAEGRSGARGRYISPDPRIMIFFNEVSSHIRMSNRESEPESRFRPMTRAMYVPAGMPLQTNFTAVHRFSHIDLHLHRDRLLGFLAPSVGRSVAQAALRRPVEMQDVDAIETLAKLLVEELTNRSRHAVYSESLVGSIATALLDIRDLVVLRENDDIAVDHVNFHVRSGEVVGIAGVQGNGQSALIEALTGLQHAASGRVTFLGKDITNASVRERHRMGMAHIPEDRHKSGMIGNFTIYENMVLNTYYDDRFSTGPNINWPQVLKTSAQYAIDFDVRTPSVYLKAGNLSGGNQQKMVVARELERETKLVIASQPTRGLDVGSIEYIHKRLMEARDEGDGVLIVSSELDEIMSLSDRILVMFEGRIVAEFDASAGPVDKNAVGLAMAGANA